ncbi:MAG: acyltransferase [Candidatus Micrarchaeota archaeon]
MRTYEEFETKKGNSLQEWYKVRNPLRVMLNFLVIQKCKFIPSLSLKNFCYRLLGMKVGKGVSVGLAVQFDIFFPELIEIGENSLIGYSATILTHEFLLKKWRKGRVKIGKNCLIGANVLILPGIEIGDNAVVSSCSLVNRNVAKNEFVGGVPIRTLEEKSS